MKRQTETKALEDTRTEGGGNAGADSNTDRRTRALAHGQTLVLARCLFLSLFPSHTLSISHTQ